MARKRMIDPEFWSDEEIGAWSFAARLFYIGLWNFSDDEGRFKAPNALLKAQIFPYEQRIDIEKLKKELNHKIQWYEVEGLQYGFIRNFLKHQKIERPTESKLPTPPQITEPSPSPHRALTPNIREVNIREVNISVTEFFEYFVLKTKTDLKINQARRQIIESRLNGGHTLEQLKQAVDNFVRDDWADRDKYVDIVYCIGIRNKVDNLEKWFNWKPKKEVRYD
jgi:uncharacterized phage protein (TIGR02220 family)